ncbi:MAG: DUF2442 domain-containing protein [Planctomycetota bacterium]
MVKAREVQPLSDYRIRVRFDDGVEGIADLAHLAGKGVFRIWDEDGVFEGVRIGGSGEIEWSDDVAICPDALYLVITGKKVEELFPNLEETSLGA